MNQCEFKTRPYLPAQVIGDIQFQAQITQAHTCQMINLEEKDMQLRVKPADLNLVCKNESPQSITVLYFNTLFSTSPLCPSQYLQILNCQLFKCWMLIENLIKNLMTMPSITHYSLTIMEQL